MKNTVLSKHFLCILISIFGYTKNSSAFIPHPDHVVVLILENTSYNEIVGSSAAPYINSLINDSNCALFTQSFGMSRPSQPNYIQLFSGSALGVTSNNLPSGLPFTAPNIGAQLLSVSKTFKGYCESLPSVGYTGETSGDYARKHNPWVNWQGSPTNGLPTALNETFLAFPDSANYGSLPHLAMVVPNQANDMHNGSYPARVTAGDTWTKNHLDSYVQWAKQNNSLFILTFDEDDFSDQHITTLFVGPMVKHGSYSNTINHYAMLRLMDEMFNLPLIAGAATAAPIDYCWIPCYQMAEVDANGPLNICQGSNVTLSAAGGISFLWSTGATTQAINVNTAGQYSVKISDGAGCTAVSSPANVTSNSFNYSGNIFSESMGTVSATTSISAHELSNSFDNDNLTMTGTGDVRNTNVSTGYTGATGGGNIFITNTLGRYFQIENINTSSFVNLQLSFGIYKNATASTGSDFFVQYSTDGLNYTSMTFDPLTTGTTSVKWYYRTAVGSIPSVNNLRIRFIQNGSVSAYRIDDVLLNYSFTSAQITANGPVNFCPGGNVTLNASPASAYQWSTGETTQSINVNQNGNYHVVETGMNGCTVASNIIPVHKYQSPAITGFVPTSGTPGEDVTINGNNFTGVTSVKINTSDASFTIINDNQIVAYVPVGAGSGEISLSNGCFTSSSPQSFAVLNDPSNLDLKLLIEGFYSGSGQMHPVLGGSNCDSVTVELREASPPYNVVYTSKKIFNTSGNGSFTFPAAANGISYYVVVNGRNSITTWSKQPILFSGTTVYDFTDSKAKAFGDNLKPTYDNLSWTVFSGDINKDGAIDGSDFLLLDVDVRSGNGGYIVTDLNGDGSSDGSDFFVMETNIINGVGVIVP